MTEAAPIRLGLLQYPVGRPASIAEFAAGLDRWLEEGRASADLLVLPEYAAVELGAGLNGGEATEAAELAAMISAAPDILIAMRRRETTSHMAATRYAADARRRWPCNQSRAIDHT